MLSGKTRSQGGDAIVRFKAFRFLIMNTQGVNHALDRLELAGKFFGHGLAVGLVLGINVMPEIFSASVLHKAEPAGALLAQDAEQDARDDDEGSRRKTVRTLQRAVGEKTAINIG